MTNTIIPIVVPVQPHSTKTVHLVATSQGGRKMRIEVTAAAGQEDAAILNDVRQSTLQGCELDKDGPLGWGFMLLMFTLAMMMLFGIGLVARIIVETAGWVPYYTPWRWPSFLPIAGDFGFWMGLFRVWSLFWPIGFVGIPVGFAVYSRSRDKAIRSR